MNTHPDIAARQADTPRACDVASALDAQLAPLAAIAAVLGDASGQAAVAELKRHTEAAAPDTRYLLGAAARVRDMLAQVRFADLVEVETEAEVLRDLAASVSWHGARMDEAMFRLSAMVTEG
ncbi:hypothetical protein [Tropicimonas sp. IMCC34011]|uniref:hypothetical protein n=1 Tax=Tropicimonas sp. IMCC34011 TaxID=2248759 RepID=UPI000E282F9D|nr:hypothetical protein [Tropicimonas sp. IMCC34011]